MISKLLYYALKLAAYMTMQMSSLNMCDAQSFSRVVRSALASILEEMIRNIIHKIDNIRLDSKLIINIHITLVDTYKWEQTPLNNSIVLSLV